MTARLSNAVLIPVAGQLSIFEEYPPRGASGVAPPVDPPRARRDDPVTSQLAAQQAKQLAHDHRTKILDALAVRDGTIYELAAATGLTHVQVARRMPELQDAKRARLKPDETRDSPSGRACRVWEISQ